MSCSRTQYLVSNPQLLDYHSLVYFSWWQICYLFYIPANRIWHFMQQKIGIDNSCNEDNLYEMSNPVFLGKWEKYIKMLSADPECQALRFHKQFAHESVHDKTLNKTCTKLRISLHIRSLIRALANHMSRYQMSWAMSEDSGQSAQLIVFIFNSRAVQSGINSATATVISIYQLDQ